ncbi:MAG: right-handed parallel beta-helix repeat-containing protein [Clostridia bacterium]|nr:right-handed parallel beta-helix repeat-containing protein [Clostridia bacterium]
MKRFKSSKKIFSAVAALAISATAIGGIMSVFNRNDKVSTVDNSSNVKKTVTIDTALGQTKSVTGNVYYTAPDGTRDGDGTMEHPFNILDILSSTMDTKLQAGDTLYVIPGTYKISTLIKILREDVKGTFNQYVRIVNAALEREQSGYKGTETQAVLDFSAMRFLSTNRGVEIDTDYIYWYGVDICGAGDNGLYIGGSYNTVEYSEFYNNRDTGLQLGRSYNNYNSIFQWPSYNLVKNCTSHNNYDNETFGENADGFAAKLTVGYGNVFDGCIAYRNSDDGWDLYAKTDSGNIGTVIMYNCVAFENGYLEYTRDECNSLFPTYDETKAYHTGENSVNPYMTRDGDGNGFKLGGSIMNGDVYLYNCLSYNNRMHGVTDNSNPGYIKSTYVTSYNNSAMVDMDGNVANEKNFDEHSNIDMSRQTYSYNAINNVLSVRDSKIQSLDSDNYRGTVMNSLLDAINKTNVIQGVIEGDTINNKKQFTSQEKLIDVAEMFTKLPNDEGTLKGNGDSMVISNGEITSLKATRVHLTCRNAADHSINMGDILAKTADGEKLIASYLGEGVTCGSELNLTSWDKYTHFYQKDLINGDAASEDMAMVERAREALTLNCVEDAVYQDFDVPVEMLNADIKWTTNDTEFITVKDGADEIKVDSSGSKFAVIEIQRDPSEDKEVTLTATITHGDASVTQDYKLILKKGIPSVGEIFVEDADGTIVYDGGKYKCIVDQYRPYREPVVRVKNGLYYDSNDGTDSTKLLKESEYDVKTTYTYQLNANTHPVAIREFTPSVAGVFTITHSVSIKGSNEVANTMTYRIYVANAMGEVAFRNDESTVVANREGFAIAGEPSSATGILYAVSSPTQLTDLTVDNIKTYSGVKSYEFRDTDINFSFANANTASYNVYYALGNVNGDITSKLYSSKINKINIDTTKKFVTIAQGSTISSEEPSRTIYTLTKNLDFKGVSFVSSTTGFSGVFNGAGYTLSNMTTTNKGIFSKVTRGTIMNVKIDNLSIEAKEDKVGFVSESSGGDFYNIAFTNVNINSSNARAAALIGHVGDTSKSGCDLTISQVSIVNSDANHRIVGTQRVGGLIGYVQNYVHAIKIDNCYVVTDIEAATTGEGGGMVAAWEDKDGDTLTITQCYYSGQLKTDVAPGSSRLGGMLGYHKGGLGELTISNCISLATHHIQGELRDVSLKNASPILGNFSSSVRAKVSVTSCISLMEEYNTDYDVEVFTVEDLRTRDDYITGKYYLNLDTETRWTIVENDDPDSDDLYKAPYVTLNFLDV